MIIDDGFGFLAIISNSRENNTLLGKGVNKLATRLNGLTIKRVDYGNLSLFTWSHHNSPEVQNTITKSQSENDDVITFLIGAVYGDTSNLQDDIDQWAGLNGRYAWLSWDANRSLFKATSDFLGIRALYYLEEQDCFLITNEPATLIESPCFNRELDPAGCLDMLQKGYCMGNRTLFKQIKYIPPKARLIRDKDKTSIYQDSILPVSFPAANNASPADLADGLWEHLNNATQRRVANKKNWHVFLSGGLDSRVCAGLLDEQSALGGLINWSSSNAMEGGDSRIPVKMANSLGVKLHSIKIPPNHLATHHDDLINLNGGLTNAHITYLISALQSLPEERPPLVVGYMGDPLTGGHVPLKTPQGNANPSLDESVSHFHRSLGEFFSADELPGILLQDEWIDAIDHSRDEIKKVMQAVDSPHHYQRWIAALIWNRQLRYTTFLPRLCEDFSPTFSPFEDLEVFKYCLAFPYKALKEQNVYRLMISKYLPKLAKYPRSDGSIVDPYASQANITQLYRRLVEKMPPQIKWRLNWWSGGGYAVDPHSDLREGSAAYLRQLVSEHDNWDIYFDKEQVSKLIEGHLDGSNPVGWRIQSLVTILEATRKN